VDSASSRSSLSTELVIGLLRGYQRFLSPLLAVLFRSGCRFYPSCSEYAAQAVARYGVWRGAYLSLRRLLRCHPFHPGGHDPLP
jgi:putative membrane protein insertion efficiency factor